MTRRRATATIAIRRARRLGADSEAQRLMAIVGFGPLTASAAIATVGDARQFKNGRQFAAWLGAVPKRVGGDNQWVRCSDIHLGR